MNAWALQTRTVSSRKWNKSFRENKGGFNAAPGAKDLWCRLDDRDLKGRRDGYGNRVDTAHGVRFRERARMAGGEFARRAMGMAQIDYLMSSDCKGLTMDDRRILCAEVRLLLNNLKMNSEDKIAVVEFLAKRKLHRWFQVRENQRKWNQMTREQRHAFECDVAMEVTFKVEDLGVCDYEPREAALQRRGEVCDAKQRLGL